MATPDLIIQTDRLNLRRFTLDDAVFVRELTNSPGWLQYIGDRGVRDLEAAGRYLLEGPLTSYQQYGFGLWAACLREEAIPIGACGLIRRHGLNHPDIGFALLPEYTGRGYALEMARATLQYAEGVLELPEILAITLPENERSIRLLQRIGMTYERMIQLPGHGRELQLFRISYPAGPTS